MPRSLVRWVEHQRDYYKSGKLSTDRIMMLEEIGFIWHVKDYIWELNYKKLVDYKVSEGLPIFQRCQFIYNFCLLHFYLERQSRQVAKYHRRY
jgi:hypothetical protein